MVYPFRMRKEKRCLPSNPLCSGFSFNKGKISWKVSGMKREKKKGKKTKYFTALSTYQKFLRPQLLFVSERMKTALVFLIRLTCCERAAY